MCLPLLCNGIVTGLRNYYSSLFGPIHWKQHGHAPANNLSLNVLWVSLGNHLFTNCKHFPSVRLDPLPRNSETLACAHEGLCSAGYWVDRFFCFGNWYLPVNGQTFENYYTNLPSGLRHNLAKGRKKLSNSGNWEITIQSAEDHLIDKAVQDFVSVYNLSWKEAEPNPNFIPNLIRLAATKGWLRLGFLSLNGKVIAAQLWLVHGGKAYIFKLAYIAGLEKFSPGSVLTCAMMQHVMEKDLVGEIDYLTGDEAYKRDWMTHRRERWGIVAFHPRSLRGIWAAFVHFAGKQFRNA